MMMVMTISANAMSYNAAKNEALFLSDKMAYELNLTAAQYEAVYEINLDYLMSLNGHADVFGTWWNRRNADLRYVLNSWQYDKYVALSHFYRPVAWKAGAWTFAVYAHYDRGRFFNAHPKVFVTYKGGNSHRDPRFYADRHMPKPAVHHPAPPVHHKAPAPTPHHGKPAPVNVGKRHGITNHTLASNTRSYLVLSAPNGIEVSHCSESVRNRLMLYFNSSKSMN